LVTPRMRRLLRSTNARGKTGMTTQVPSLATLAPEPATGDEDNCLAFNAAFRELGFRWRWTFDDYSGLSQFTCDRDRIRVYLETAQPHLFVTYDADFLIDAIHSAKVRCHSAICAGGNDGPAAVL